MQKDSHIQEKFDGIRQLEIVELLSYQIAFKKFKDAKTYVLLRNLELGLVQELLDIGKRQDDKKTIDLAKWYKNRILLGSLL